MKYFRNTIAEMDGYVPGEQPKSTNLVKLNTNENPYDPSPQAQGVLKNSTWYLNRYPDPTAAAVREAAACVVGGAADQILVGNGSDDLLTILTRAVVDQGGTMGCLEPSYSLYPALAQIQGACLHRVPLEEDFSLPAYAPELAGEASIMVLTSPNAPTGNSLVNERVAGWCERFDGLVVVDEAYADFADWNASELVRQYGNCVVLRTLSKGYSLAGIRLGFAYTNATVIQELTKVKDSYNVNSLTQAVAVAALADQETLLHNVGLVRATRQRLALELRRLGFAVLPSNANFVFAKPPYPAQDYYQDLREHEIIVRYFPGLITGSFVRITIGTDCEIDRLLEVTSRLTQSRFNA